MDKVLDDIELNLHNLLDLIESDKIFLYKNWQKVLVSVIPTLSRSDFSILQQYLSRNDDLRSSLDELFHLPEKLWANLNIRDSLVIVDIVDPPYSFIFVEECEELNQFNKELEIHKKIEIFKDPNKWGSYVLKNPIEREFSLNIDKTVAACLVAFSLQFPSSLTAFGNTEQNLKEPNSVISLLKENYESLQNTKNKNFAPLLKTMYKINELSSKNYYAVDEHVDKIEQEEMEEHVTEMINSFYKHLNQTKKDARKIAKKVLEVSKDKGIDYRIFLSIIREESNFKQTAYNPSGDYSLAQINYNIWKDDYKKISKKPLILKKLKQDINYSVDAMGNILSYLKKHYHKDPLWYARYHSKTPSKKLEYAQKLQKHLDHLNRQETEELQNSILEFNLQLSQIDRNEFQIAGVDDSKISHLNNELSSMLVHFGQDSKIAYNDD